MTAERSPKSGGGTTNARARHPSAGAWRSDVDRLAAKLAERLRGDGVAFPEAAAAALAVRGHSGLPRWEFSVVAAVAEDLVAACEEGWLPGFRLPPVYRRLGGFLDWARIDADGGSLNR